MTRAKTKTEPPPTGRTYKGRLIVGTLMEMRKMGGEFSEKLEVTNPELLKDCTVGTRLTVAVDLVCIDEHYPAEDRKEPDDGGVYEKFVFDPEDVVVIDRTKVAKDFKAQADAMQAAKDATAGQEAMATDGELHQAHEAGEHAGGIVDGCPDCDEEAALEADGQ